MDRSDLEKIVGPVDNQLAAEIAGTGATRQELAEAMTWLNADDAMVSQGRPMPSGRVARLIEILEAPEDDHPEAV